MPRFSAKTKEIWDTLSYHTDISKANKTLEGLKDPLDITFGKLFIAWHYFMFQQQSKFLVILAEIENENKILKDQFIQFMINYYYCLYYMGGSTPIVSKGQAEKYFDYIEQSYQGIDYKDDWEKNYCIGWYYDSKAQYEEKFKDDLSNAIKFEKKCIEAWSKIPEDGEYHSAGGYITLSFYYGQNGDFDEAEKSINRALLVYKKYNNLFQRLPLVYLSWLKYLKGDLQKAKELNEKGLEVAKHFDNSYGIYGSLTRKGSYLWQEGEYDESIKTYQESLVYRKQHGDPLSIFWGYFRIFDLYHRRFKTTKDKAFFTQAEQTLTDLQELSKTYSDNKTMINYTNYAQSLILKYGNVRKRAKSIDILEELIKYYPNNIEISLNLLELLFEDVIQSEDQDTINQIVELMEKVIQIPLRNNPQAIFSFISQQIFLAKYIYYIKGDISVALNILHNSTDHVKKFKLNNLVKILDAEIQILENQLTKWDDVDISVKKRIVKSEFNKYIQQALSIADKQT